MGIASDPEALTAAAQSGLASVARSNKGKEIDWGADTPAAPRYSLQPTHPMEGGPVGPPPGFGPRVPESAATFLLPSVDYLPTAHQYFKDAITLADEKLWGSHSLRLSLKTEYAAFLYECVHDQEASRKIAKETIAEVYDAQEGMDDDMFNDACELVTVLGRMMKRGLNSSNPPQSRGQSPSTQQTTPKATASAAAPPEGMENPI